ncbi:MAG: hypothetical protein B7Y02_16670, partial [Rhodobacterales bacterium 17-64-5]
MRTGKAGPHGVLPPAARSAGLRFAALHPPPPFSTPRAAPARLFGSGLSFGAKNRLLRSKSARGASGVRIGVIGCGLWGKNHARTLGVLGALGGVADANPAASAALAAAMDCKALAVQDLIEDPGLDGLIVAVSPAMQAQVALRVLAAGRPVLVEKPIALTPAEARAVVRAAEAAGVVAMTGHLLRYHPAFEAVQALHAAGS